MSVATFLTGGPFDGDKASLPGHVPPVLAVTALGHGQTDWKDAATMYLVGDRPSQPAFYALVRRDTVGLIDRAVYAYYGQDYPTGRERARHRLRHAEPARLLIARLEREGQGV